MFIALVLEDSEIPTSVISLPTYSSGSSVIFFVTLETGYAFALLSITANLFPSGAKSDVPLTLKSPVPVPK